MHVNVEGGPAAKVHCPLGASNVPAGQAAPVAGVVVDSPVVPKAQTDPPALSAELTLPGKKTPTTEVAPLSVVVDPRKTSPLGAG